MPVYDPFKEIQTLMNQAFSGAKSLAMPMDLYKSGDTYVAEIDLPGVEPASIDIDVEDRTITIRAERRPDQARQGSEWVTRERSFGTYARQISVGSGLALDKVTGEYNDGVLTLTIPVAEEAKPRKVQVQLGSGAKSLGGSDVVEGSVEDDAPAKPSEDDQTGEATPSADAPAEGQA